MCCSLIEVQGGGEACAEFGCWSWAWLLWVREKADGLFGVVAGLVGVLDGSGEAGQSGWLVSLGSMLFTMGAHWFARWAASRRRRRSVEVNRTRPAVARGSWFQTRM